MSINGVCVDTGQSEMVAVTLARIDVRLAAMQDNMIELKSDVNELKDDHEKRLRDLEKWRWSMPAGIGILANLMVEWLKSKVGG